MNQIKINLLEKTFKNPFNIDSFKRFTREFFNEADMLIGNRRTGITREYNDYINAYYTLAKYEDSQANNLIVMAVELKRDSSINRARSMQRNFISKILYDEDLEAAIVAFYVEGMSSWRLSLVRLDYTFTEKGLRIKLRPAKRYSYLVGKNEPNHTALSQLLPIFQDDNRNPTLDEIEEAFSVEKVTRDFFMQYREKYLELKEYLETDGAFIEEAKSLGFDTNKFAEQFSKKLMGQLAFLYFIQKKGWLGVRIVPKEITKEDLTQIYNSIDKVRKDILERAYARTCKNKYALDIELISSKNFTDHEAELLSDIFINNDKFDKPWGSGSKQFIRNILWKHCEISKKNFFNDYLEPFFYDALNKKRKNHYFKSFNSKIPFLNGGLFEPIEGYHWRDINFQIPNYIFSNKEEKDMESDGILDIFDRFNFTINEAEPLEKDVAVDPEMLGKIFEELLEVSDRKSKGAFYTPREIVHYMCQESLINYLVNEVGVPYEDMKEFILYGELIRDADNRRDVGYGREFTIRKSILNNISEIDDALENVRVADPAVGSGAFPLGMLNEIIKVRNNITEYIIKKDKNGAFGERFGEEFIRNYRSPYKMKLKTIKNSIFAVDIEPSAIDITRLRLWLSIVVDQEIDEENKEPHPLPNLDMNIHVGNSLIDEYEGIKLFDKSILESKKKYGKKKNQKVEQIRWFYDSDDILDEMFEKQSQYFDEVNEDNKQALKSRIDDLRDKLIVQCFKESGNKEAIKKYEKIKKQKTKPYFIWELEFAKVFKEKGGFDIVIGNPPYLESRSPSFDKTIKNLLQKIIKDRYGKGARYFPKGTDLLIYFFELSLRIIKPLGVNVFITQNSWLDTEYGRLFQDFLMGTTNVLAVIDSDFKYFENANINTVITIFEGRDGFYKDILFARTHRSLEEYSLDITMDLKPSTDVTAKIIYKDNKLLKETKWGFLFNSSDRFLKILDIVSMKGKNLNEIKDKFTIGQGLNLTKDYYFNVDDVKEFKLKENEIIPIMTVKESGVYNWKETQTYLVNKNSISKERIDLLRLNKKKLFDDKKTKKVPPVLILPRGVGAKHYCSFNEVNGYSASFVDIYAKDKKVLKDEVLFLWIFLNSTICWTMREMSGRKNLGGGMLKAEAVDLKPFPIYYEFNDITNIRDIFKEAKKLDVKNSMIELNEDIHNKIDEIVFNHLEIKQTDRIYIRDLFLKNINQRYSKSKR